MKFPIMKNPIILSKGLIFALFALLGLSACQDDTPANQLSKTEAKDAIADFNSTAASDLQALSGSTGTAALQELFDLIDVDDPFGRIGITDREQLKVFFKNKGRAFKTIFVPTKAINGRIANVGGFDFEAHKGIYTWNAQLAIFEKTGVSSIIIIQFPTEGSLNNNAELQLKAFSEMEIYDEEWQEYSYLPTEILAELYVGESKVASLDFEAAWDDVGFPISVDITLAINDFTFQLSLDTSGLTSSTLSLSFTRGEETIIAASITVKYGNQSKSEESLEKIEGFVQFKNLTLKGNVNILAADANEVNWNDVFNLSLYSNDKKLGDIVFVDVDGELIPYVKYADGSKEKLETVLQPVIDEIDNLATQFGLN